MTVHVRPGGVEVNFMWYNRSFVEPFLSLLYSRVTAQALDLRPSLLSQSASVDQSLDPRAGVNLLGHTIGTVENAKSFIPMRSATTKRCVKTLLPKLVYIGLNHAGSSTLAQNLNSHPNISYGLMKEHVFFHYTHSRTVETYEQQFQVDCSVSLTFDASPCYFGMGNDHATRLNHWHPYNEVGRQGVENVRDILGSDIKMIFMVRDPVDWLNSMRYLKDGTTSKSTHGEGWDAEPMSCFADSLQTWIDVFGKDQFFFLKSETFFNDQQQTIDRLLNWLDLPPFQINPSSAAGRRRQSHRVPMEERTRYHSNPQHRECKARLENITGLSFEWEGS